MRRTDTEGSHLYKSTTGRRLGGDKSGCRRPGRGLRPGFGMIPRTHSTVSHITITAARLWPRCAGRDTDGGANGDSSAVGGPA